MSYNRVIDTLFKLDDMAKRKDNLEGALLLLQILNLIPKNRKITAHEIWYSLKENGFERTLRSIQRHLKMLCEYFEIECDDSSLPHGYKWKEKSQGLSLPMLTEQQSLLLMLAQKQLSHILPPNVINAISPFFTQAKHQLIYDNKGKLANQWLKKVDIIPMHQQLLPAKVNPDIFDNVSTALYRNHYLNIVYRNVNDRQHKAQVMPLALVHQDGRSYLLVRYPEYGTAVKQLALHRMLSAEVSTMTFDYPDDFDLKAYKDAGHFAYGAGRTIKLIFSTTFNEAYYLQETPLSHDQIILEQGEDYCRIQATVIDSMLLDWWLAKFGDDIWDVVKEKIEKLK